MVRAARVCRFGLMVGDTLEQAYIVGFEVSGGRMKVYLSWNASDKRATERG